jgi:hypothetical protein
VAAHLREDGDRALQLRHRPVLAAGAVQRVGEVIAKRRLAVAVALGGHEPQRVAHELGGRVEVARGRARAAASTDLWHDAGIRSGIYVSAEPIRMIARPFRRGG